MPCDQLSEKNNSKMTVKVRNILIIYIFFNFILPNICVFNVFCTYYSRVLHCQPSNMLTSISIRINYVSYAECFFLWHEELFPMQRVQNQLLIRFNDGQDAALEGSWLCRQQDGSLGFGTDVGCLKILLNKCFTTVALYCMNVIQTYRNINYSIPVIMLPLSCDHPWTPQQKPNRFFHWLFDYY